MHCQSASRTIWVGGQLVSQWPFLAKWDIYTPKCVWSVLFGVCSNGHWRRQRHCSASALLVRFPLAELAATNGLHPRARVCLHYSGVTPLESRLCYGTRILMVEAAYYA
jgi:hypothetical protein